MNFFASKPVTLACQGARGQYSFPALYYIPKTEMSSKRTVVFVRLLFGFHVMLVDCGISISVAIQIDRCTVTLTHG